MNGPRPESEGQEYAHQHSTRNVFKYHKHGKSLVPPQRSEVAPLLANGNEEDTEADGAREDASGKVSKGQKLRDKSNQMVQWIQGNVKLIAVVLLLIAGIITLCVYLGMTYGAKSSPKPTSVCLTPACVLAASEILQNLSPNHNEIDPCTNFDQFVCEGWQEKHDLRADQGSSFTGTIMAENSQRLLRHVLESGGLSKELKGDDQEIFGKMHSAYDACMNEDKVKKLGSAPLLEILRKIEELFPAKRPNHVPESFPILTTSQQKGLHYDGGNQLSRTISYLTSIGIAPLVTFDIAADDKDPDSMVIFLTAPRRPGLPDKAYYKDEKLVASYSETIGQVLEALLREASPNVTTIFRGGYGRPSKTSENLVKAIVNLESKLAEVTPNTEDADDVTKYYNPRTLEEARALFPQISIQHIISSLAPQYDPRRIIVGSPSYLKNASSILHGTTAETLQAYFVWKTVQAYADKVEDDALKPLKRFENQLQGKDPDALAERWRTCVKHVDNGLGWILSRFFIEKAFSREAKDFGDHIVSAIKAQFIKTLKVTKWMTEDVRSLGIEKVHNIVQKIGYPTVSPNIEDPSVLKGYYAALTISNTSYFDNALAVAKFDTVREWSALGVRTDRDHWDMTAPTVTAYYNPAGNEIVFPAGIMQAPVFHNPRVPQYLSYGAFGSVSGHALLHAFDSSGRHYDQFGNFTNWWSNQTVEAFKEKARCFIDQYHEFTVSDPNGKLLHVNGGLTIGENIADAGGLNAAFAAWKEREKDEPGQLLPGLQGFTKEQLFFVSYGNWWCGKVRTEAAIESIYTDPHAPIWARIKGTMDNSRDFKTAFNCPRKEARCELW